MEPIVSKIIQDGEDGSIILQPLYHKFKKRVDYQMNHKIHPLGEMLEIILDGMDRRFEKMDKKLDGISKSIENLRVNGFEVKGCSLHKDIRYFHTTASKHEMKLWNLDMRLDKLEAGINERHFIIIDEVGELNPSEAFDKDDKKLKEACQRYMSQIARLGAGLGFRQILATQYPTGDVIPRQCKQNSDAKLCFRVQNGTASRVVLDENGAEQLPEIKGRAIFQSADKRITVQTPLITSEIVQKTITPHLVKKEEKSDENKTIKPTPRVDSVVIEET